MPLDKDPDVDVTQSADEDETSDPYIDVQIDDNAASDAVSSSAEPRIRDSSCSDSGLQRACSVRDRINQFERLSQSAPSHELERVQSDNHEYDHLAGGAVQNERGAGQGAG